MSVGDEYLGRCRCVAGSEADCSKTGVCRYVPGAIESQLAIDEISSLPLASILPGLAAGTRARALPRRLCSPRRGTRRFTTAHARAACQWLRDVRLDSKRDLSL